MSQSGLEKTNLRIPLIQFNFNLISNRSSILPRIKIAIVAITLLLIDVRFDNNTLIVSINVEISIIKSFALNPIEK